MSNSTYPFTPHPSKMNGNSDGAGVLNAKILKQIMTLLERRGKGVWLFSKTTDQHIFKIPRLCLEGPCGDLTCM